MAEEKFFHDLLQLLATDVDAADQFMIYDDSEADPEQKVKRIKWSELLMKLGLSFEAKGSGGGGKFMGLYADGAKAADTYWIHNNKIWRTKQAFNSAAAPMAGAYWEVSLDIPEAKFAANTITTDAVGRVAAGTDISGKSATEFLLLASISYQAPSFSSFGITGEGNATVPLGYKVLAANRTFTWGTSNAGNVAANSISLRNHTANVDLKTALANDGSEVVTLTADILLNTDGGSVTFRITGTNSQGAGFTRDFTITSRPYIYWGVAPANSVINEAFIRSLPNKALASGHPANISGNMGAGQKLFYFYPKAYGNRYFKTALGTLGASLIQNGGVNVRTQEQIDGALAGLEYSGTASEQAGLGQTTYDLSAS